MKIRQILFALIPTTTLTSALSIPPPPSNAKPEPRIEARGKKDPGMPKYFHEPGGSALGNHYDTRYYHGIDTYENKRDTQLHMLRAYFKFFSEASMETWLAHGTLLGWWWNGKMLPWDWDIDTQVSGSTLAFMGKHHNQTLYNYTASDDPDLKRTYMLDVNPASVERERGNGNNIIDARWIDVRNGLYIDITGLSETHPNENPGVWSCKNYHRYKTTDLYPMRETMYEGAIAKVPYAYDRILTQEYHEKALIVTDYENHRWNSEQKEWIKKSDEEIAQEKAEKEAKKKAKDEEKKKKQEEENKRKQEEENRKKEEEENKKKEEEESNKQEEEGKTQEEEPAKQEEQKDEKKDKRSLVEERTDDEPERETSGLAHLRRKRDVDTS